MKCVVCNAPFNAPPIRYNIPNPDMCRPCATRAPDNAAFESDKITLNPDEFVPFLMAAGLTRPQAVAEAKKRGLPKKYWEVSKVPKGVKK